MTTWDMLTATLEVYQESILDRWLIMIASSTSLNFARVHLKIGIYARTGLVSLLVRNTDRKFHCLWTGKLGQSCRLASSRWETPLTLPYFSSWQVFWSDRLSPYSRSHLQVTQSFIAVLRWLSARRMINQSESKLTRSLGSLRFRRRRRSWARFDWISGI